jgi:hypothetical protein
MIDLENWSWEEGRRVIADLSRLRDQYADVHECVVSRDGESIAVPVVKGPDRFGVWFNGSLWEGEYEKAWHLEFTPDGRLSALEPDLQSRRLGDRASDQGQHGVLRGRQREALGASLSVQPRSRGERRRQRGGRPGPG